MQLSTNLRLRRQHALRDPKAHATDRERKLCRAAGCNHTFANGSGRVQHEHALHPDFIAQPSSDPITAGPIFPGINTDSDSASTENEDEGSGSSFDSCQRENTEAGLSTQERGVTIEEVEDEDDIMSATSGDSQARTRRTFHDKLTGKFDNISPRSSTDMLL